MTKVEFMPEKNFYQRFKHILKRFGITIAEWHSLIVGAGTAAIGGPALAAPVYALATGGSKLTGHLKDVRKELGYFIGSFCVVEGIEWLLTLAI